MTIALYVLAGIPIAYFLLVLFAFGVAATTDNHVLEHLALLAIAPAVWFVCAIERVALRVWYGRQD